MKQSLLYDLVELFAPLTSVDATGILIHQATDLYTLWEKLEDQTTYRGDPPFWGFVWPGARLLAGYILKNPSLVAGKKVLDIRAGCGIVAIATLLAGAQQAVANDIDDLALSVIQLNAAANNVPLITDNRDLLTTIDRDVPDVVMVADLFYEATTAASLYTLLHDYAQQGTDVFIADGNRPFTPRNQLTLLTTATIRVNEAVEGKAERKVSLYKLAYNQPVNPFTLR